MPSYAVVGLGALGARVARVLHSCGQPEELLLVDTASARAGEVAAAIGGPSRPASWRGVLEAGVDVVVLAHGGDQVGPAEAALGAGAHVIATTGALAQVRRLLELGPPPGRPPRHLVVGAAFAPGMACLLAAHAARPLDRIDQIKVASLGAAGPACRDQQRQGLRTTSLEWDRRWLDRPGGSGRELCWFPEPIGGRDCYLAGSGASLLLHRAFPVAELITAKQAASFWERARALVGAAAPSRLSVAAPAPGGRARGRGHHGPEGPLGALRVEVSGARGGVPEVRILGVVDRPGLAGGAVAGVAAHWAATGRLSRPGNGGLAELVEDTAGFLARLAERGVKAAVFDGASGQS